jgi:hypothetical protein
VNVDDFCRRRGFLLLNPSNRELFTEHSQQLIAFVIWTNSKFIDQKKKPITYKKTYIINNAKYIRWQHVISRFTYNIHKHTWHTHKQAITNMAWVRARLCKLQKRVHSARSRMWSSLPVACPGSVVLSGYSGFFHH